MPARPGASGLSALIVVVVVAVGGATQLSSPPPAPSDPVQPGEDHPEGGAGEVVGSSAQEDSLVAGPQPARRYARPLAPPRCRHSSAPAPTEPCTHLSPRPPLLSTLWAIPSLRIQRYQACVFPGKLQDRPVQGEPRLPTASSNQSTVQRPP